jgi:hypothetical protein
MTLEFFRSGNYSELRDMYPAWVIEQANQCFKHFEKWTLGKDFEPILMEQPLVSEKYQFGGCEDWFGRIRIEGAWQFRLIDYKTCKHIWKSHFYQLAGYRELLLENGHEAVDEVEIVHLPRSEKEGKFRTLKRTKEEIRLQWQIFKHGLEMYHLQMEEPKYVS